MSEDVGVFCFGAVRYEGVVARAISSQREPMAAAAGAVPPKPNRLVKIEALRGLAAFYVFVHHYGHGWIARRHPVLRPLFSFGQVAVMLFFFLSGFVIHHATTATKRELTFGDYFIRRFRR